MKNALAILRNVLSNPPSSDKEHQALAAVEVLTDAVRTLKREHDDPREHMMWGAEFDDALHAVFRAAERMGR